MVGKIRRKMRDVSIITMVDACKHGEKSEDDWMILTNKISGWALRKCSRTQDSSKMREYPVFALLSWLCIRKNFHIWLDDYILFICNSFCLYLSSYLFYNSRICMSAKRWYNRQVVSRCGRYSGKIPYARGLRMSALQIKKGVQYRARRKRKIWKKTENWK